MKTLILMVFSLVFASSCGTKPAENGVAKGDANSALQSQPSATPAFEPLTAEAVMNAFKTANFPITGVVTYNEETDENHLLGRPHQYTAKVNWADSRAKSGFDKNPFTIELFAAQEDLEARKAYVEKVTAAASPLAQYIYPHKNVLLRLPHKLLPKDAAEYERILKTL